MQGDNPPTLQDWLDSFFNDFTHNEREAVITELILSAYGDVPEIKATTSIAGIYVERMLAKREAEGSYTPSRA